MIANLSLTEWVKVNPSYLVCVCSAFLLFSVYSLLCLKWFKVTSDGSAQRLIPRPNLACRGKWLCTALAASCLLAFTSLSLLLYTSWLRGDEWMFFSDAYTPLQRFLYSLSSYLFRNSRLGESVGFFVSVSECKWQVFILNSAFAVAVPFGLLRLFGRRGESLASPLGLCFFWFSFCLALMSACLSPWRNYVCFAASVNYLWPSVITIFFLSVFNPAQWSKSVTPVWKKLALFLIGLYCGCSVESLSVTLLPILTIWMFWRLWCKMPIPALCKYAYLGFLWGTFFLFASPSLYRRADNAILAIDVSLFSPEQMSAFVHNLSWEQLAGLSGAGSIVVLKGIPLLYHAYFLPFVADKFLQCCSVGCVAFALLLLPLAFQRGIGRKKLASTGLLIFGLGWICAASYTVQCIPMHMSFLPAAFFILAACAYLFLALAAKSAWLSCTATSIATLAMALATFVPAGIEAWPLKDVEQARFDEIHMQIEKGEKNVNLQLQLNSIPEDPLCLTDLYHFPITRNPKEWSNDIMACAYHLETLTQYTPILEQTKVRPPVYGPCYEILYDVFNWVKINILNSQSDPFGKHR